MSFQRDIEANQVSATHRAPTAMQEYSGNLHDLERETLMARAQPLVMRGLVSDWPAVHKARQSDTAFAKYLAGLDSGAPVDVLLVPAEDDGVVGYDADLTAFNYEHHRVSVTLALRRLARYSREHSAAGLAIQSAPVDACLPDFGRQHGLRLLDPAVRPRIWIGNHVTTPTHFDAMCNIACVVCGARRFTLFPPDQIGNLYIGPPDFAPTGAPISMARVDRPDDPRFPRMRTALAHAQVADLLPGDAVYIPPLWWHNVESIRQLNALVNYWWLPVQFPGYVDGHGMAAFYHCVLAYRSLPPAERAAWKGLLEHYVFAEEEPLAHVPAARRGVLSKPPDAAQVRQLKELARRFLDDADTP